MGACSPSAWLRLTIRASVFSPVRIRWTVDELIYLHGTLAPVSTTMERGTIAPVSNETRVPLRLTYPELLPVHYRSFDPRVSAATGRAAVPRQNLSRLAQGHRDAQDPGCWR